MSLKFDLDRLSESRSVERRESRRLLSLFSQPSTLTASHYLLPLVVVVEVKSPNTLRDNKLSP